MMIQFAVFGIFATGGKIVSDDFPRLTSDWA